MKRNVISKKDLYPLEPRSGETKIFSSFFFIRSGAEGKRYAQELDRNFFNGHHAKGFAKTDRAGRLEVWMKQYFRERFEAQQRIARKLAYTLEVNEILEMLREEIYWIRSKARLIEKPD